METTGTQTSGLGYRHVLVPLDGSEFAEAALPAAHALAARFNATVHTITIAMQSEDVGDLRGRAAAALATTRQDARVHVIVGDDPPGAIKRRVQELGECAVCLSTRGHGRVAGAVVGSVARSLLQQAREPMVAIGPVADRRPPFVSTWPATLSPARLVACVDGSAASEAVLPVASAWATALDMSLTILTVAEPVLVPLRPDRRQVRRYGPDGDADEYVKGLAEQWQEAAPGVSSLVVYDPISPAQGVRAHLDKESAGLVAVTTHARSGWKRLLLGAVAASIVQVSVAPVLVVPPLA